MSEPMGSPANLPPETNEASQQWNGITAHKAFCEIDGCLVCYPTKKAKHFDSGKPQFQNLLFFTGLEDISRVFEYGATKYGMWNFLKGGSWMAYLGSAIRHIRKMIRGEWIDSESGISHAAHACADLLIVLQWFYDKQGIDDRPKV